MIENESNKLSPKNKYNCVTVKNIDIQMYYLQESD